MSEQDKPFFRRVADQALDEETAQQIAEQRAALAANPEWAEGYFHLAQLYRVQQKPQEAKRQLLTALEKKPALAEAHIALGEIYIAECDLVSARTHAQFAAALGNGRLLEQMKRHGG